MKLKKLFLFCALGFSIPAWADPVDGYVGALFNFALPMSSVESGTRIGARIEFARLSSFISLDARYSKGQGYTDFGSVLRIFKHWNFSQSSGTGMSVGLGGGANYAPSQSSAAGITNVMSATGNQRGFTEPVIAPFVRCLVDVGMGWGLIADIEYQIIPGRYFSGTESPRSDSGRQRLSLAIGAAIEI